MKNLARHVGFIPGKIGIMTSSDFEYPVSDLEQSIIATGFAPVTFVLGKEKQATWATSNNVPRFSTGRIHELIEEFGKQHIILTYVDSGFDNNDIISSSAQDKHASLVYYTYNTNWRGAVAAFRDRHAIDYIEVSTNFPPYLLSEHIAASEEMVRIPPGWFKDPEPFCSHCISFPDLGTRYFARFPSRGNELKPHSIHRENCPYRPEFGLLQVGHYEPDGWVQVRPIKG